MPPKELLDEIPPDPVNFLREDGGDDKPKSEPTRQNQRPPNKNRTQTRNRQDRPRQERGNDDIDGNLGDSPPRPRNQNQRPRQMPQQQQQNRSTQEGGPQKRPIHPQQLRNERRSAPVPSDEPQGNTQQHTPNRQRRPNYRQPNKETDRNNITVEITDGEVRSVKCECWHLLL